MYRSNSGIAVASPVYGKHSARKFKAVPKSALSNLQRDYNGNVSAIAQDLKMYGIGLDSRMLHKMYVASNDASGFAMDAAQVLPATQPSMPVPIQYLQNWLPGFVHILTQARKIDNLIGMLNTGSWEDEQVVQGVMEQLGTAVPYGDYTTVPFSSWNANYVWRNVVRFEEGMQVGVLESAQAARGNINNDAEKRAAAGLALDIQRNTIGFYGYNTNYNQTYGFLNEPNLSPYVTASTGASSSTTWASKTYLEIQADILGMITRVRSQSGDQIDPKTTPMTLAVAANVVDQLMKSSNFGVTVSDWLARNYPNIRIESAPELNGANGGQNVAYLYADRVNDSSTDDGKVWEQLVPTRFQVVGVAQLVKTYVESFTNAMAGVMLKRPYGNTRLTGI